MEKLYTSICQRILVCMAEAEMEVTHPDHVTDWSREDKKDFVANYSSWLKPKRGPK